MKVKDIIANTKWFPSRKYYELKPLVSVLLPTYRRGGSGLFLKASQSVLNQSLSELELIIVDDGSTDGTADQIRELMGRDDRVSCLHHPENVGLPAISEYEAFLKARANYLAFAFDDDEFYPNALQDLLICAVKNDFSVIHGYVDIQYWDPSTNKYLKIPNFGRQGIPQATLVGTNYLSNNAVLLHRRVIEKIGFYDPHVAVSRICDWDLWRRIAQHFKLVAVDVSVGQVLGPSTGDSLGHTYQMEPWQVIELINSPRNEKLIPTNFGNYDVLEIPDTFSRQTQLAIEEIKENFKNKFWYHKKSVQHSIPIPPETGEDNRIEEGRILVVTSIYDASTSLYFDHLPQFYHQRVRIISPKNWPPEEMIGASAVIFVRLLPFFKEWIDYARKLKIPHYYFLDDNLILIRNESAFSDELSFFTEKNIRDILGSFSGVLLSSNSLIDFFKENDLHKNLFYYPPIVNLPKLFEKIGHGHKRDKVIRIAYFGGSHRLPLFRETVLPAIYEFSKYHLVELFIGGMDNNSLETKENLKIFYFPFEISYDLALARFASFEIDLLVHPKSKTANNPYKTLNVLINALAMNAIPILNIELPYDPIELEKIAFFCDNTQESWLEAIEKAYESPGLLKDKKVNLELFCQKHFNGEANVKVLEQILKNHPYSGPVLRDTRYRTLVYLLRQEASKNKYHDLFNPKVIKRRFISLSRRLLHNKNF